MKHAFTTVLRLIVLLLAARVSAIAQAPPGWAWAQHLGVYAYSATGQNEVAGLGRDAAGNLYLLGTYVGTPVLSGTPTTRQGDTDMFLAKYTPAGNLLWLRLLQSSGGDYAGALSVEPSGRCTLSGAFGNTTGGDLSFTNFNSATTLPGTVSLGLAAPTPLGYYSLPFVASVDANGTLLWADTPSTTAGLGVNFMDCDNSGNCYLSASAGTRGSLIIKGQTYPGIGSNDAVLMKYTATGQLSWARRVGSPQGLTVNGSVKTDNAGAVYWLLSYAGSLTIDHITATSTGLYSLVKLSASNRVRWIKDKILRIGTNGAIGSLLSYDAPSNKLYLSCISAGGDIVFDGGGPIPVTSNAVTMCVAQCDTAAQVQWVKAYAYSTIAPGGLPGFRSAGINGFAVRGTGFTLATTTVYSNQTTYIGSARTYGPTESGLACVLHFNTTTNQTEWVRVGGAPFVSGQNSSTSVVAAVVDAADNVFVAGSVIGNAQFGATSFSTSTVAHPDMFLARLDQAVPTATATTAPGRAWSIFPNPATDEVQLSGLPAAAQVRVYDALGRLVRTLPPVASASAPRTVRALPAGLYLLQVANTPESYRSQRLVVE